MRIKHLTRWALVAGTAVAMATPGTVAAHNPDPATACDTSSRQDFGEYTHGNPSHHHTYQDDQEVGPAYVHAHSGHYYVRADDVYVEVVGGQGYNDNGAQGGYVQGSAGDASFHFHFFDNGRARVCVGAAGEKVDLENEPVL